MAPTQQHEEPSWYRDILMISMLITLLFGAFLGSRPLMVPDEGRYAEIPREMVVNSDYVTPRVNGIKYFEKPPLFYWMQAASIKAFGINEWALRFPNALMGLMGCLIVYAAGRKIYNRRTGLFASAILATSALFFGMAHIVTLDMTTAIFISATLLSFLFGTRAPPGPARRNWMWAMYTAAAAATLTKGLIGIILPGAVIFAWLSIMGRWREIATFCLPTGLLLYLLITLPWHILIQYRHPEFLGFYLLDQQILRYFTTIASRDKPIWFMPSVLLAGFLPWTAFLPPAIYQVIPRWKNREVASTELFLLLWGSIIFVFFWFSQSQLIPYLVPILPPLALLTAQYIDRQLTTQHYPSLRNGFLINLVLCILAVIVGLAYFGFHQIPMLVTIILAGCVGLFTWFIFRLSRQITHAFTALVITSGLFLTSLNVSFPPTDTRGVKPLAMKLRQIMQPGDTVISYFNYNQDLPVYLQQIVPFVGNYDELRFGQQHQDTTHIAIQTKDFWKRWQMPQRIYMIVAIKNMKYVKKPANTRLIELARTKRYLLLTNHELAP